MIYTIKYHLIARQADTMHSATSLSPRLPEQSGADPTPCRYQRIREVALDLFVSEGYSKVSLRQLGKEIGLHAGSLYSHLHSKEELLFELISDHLEELLTDVRRRIARQPDATSRLIALIDAHIDSQVRQRALSLLTNLELRSLNGAHREAVNALLKSHRDCLAKIIRDGMKDGHFHPQPLPIAVQGILSMLSGIAFWFDDQRDLDEKQLKRHLTTMALGALQAA